MIFPNALNVAGSSSQAEPFFRFGAGLRPKELLVSLIPFLAYRG